MQRIGYTILYNGLHHLTHGDFCNRMLSMFDYWIVVEGLAGASGSTRWCRNLPLPGRSTDGSHQYMLNLARQNKKLLYYSPGGKWGSKDSMINKAVDITRQVASECYLWQVDVDEHWKPEQLSRAESELTGKTGGFQFTHYLCRTDDGRQLVARGVWGSGLNTRLWKWKGESYLSHEPPLLERQGRVQHLSPVYDHYSYRFEQDIVFKTLYYGYKELHTNWLKLKSYTGDLPIPLSFLLGNHITVNARSSTIELLNTENNGKETEMSHMRPLEPAF